MQGWTGGEENGQNASEFSVPLVLLLTETGVSQNGASEGATPAPTTKHEDDNSLGYTGTAAAYSCLFMCPHLPALVMGNVKLILDDGHFVAMDQTFSSEQDIVRHSQLLTSLSHLIYILQKQQSYEQEYITPSFHPSII